MKNMKMWVRPLIPIVMLVVLTVVVVLQRYGVVVSADMGQAANLEFDFTESVQADATTLLLTSSEDELSKIFEPYMADVLDGMAVVHDTIDAEKFDFAHDLDKYDKIIITFENWDIIGDDFTYISDWVNLGGSLMNVCTPAPTTTFISVSRELGIIERGSDYASITGLKIAEGSMIGADDEVWSLGEEPLTTSLQVSLTSDTDVYVTNEDGTLPILWKEEYGAGSYIIINDIIDALYQEGFFVLGYSLMDSAILYPVINASVFYLDDFPSPVPGGNSEFVQRDYGVDTATFYSTVWWPTVMGWETKYGIKHTGVIIEDYSDDVDAPFDTQSSTSRFTQFGNMLLDNGGELGFHGYNHEPLLLKGVDDSRQYGYYKLWNSQEDISSALIELNTFCTDLFPDSDFTVYVPPSNIMSDTTRAIIHQTLPNVKVIAATLLPDADSKAYTQKFGVGEDGLIDTPRITSGCDIDYYAKLTALSELNYQYVQSHFMHPDDCLDVDRGAELGWAALAADMESYLDWVYTSAPNIRDTTGSEIGSATLKYSNVSLDTEITKDAITADIGGFSEDAQFLLRINDGTPGKATGCTVEHITGNIYSVTATSSQITIAIEH